MTNLSSHFYFAWSNSDINIDHVLIIHTYDCFHATANDISIVLQGVWLLERARMGCGHLSISPAAPCPGANLLFSCSGSLSLPRLEL